MPVPVVDTDLVEAAAPLPRWREIVLSAGAVLGTLCLIMALSGALLGIKPLVFRSGSMSPAITTGSLALARTVPVADLAVGDIVSVEAAASGVRVTHRIASIETAAGAGRSSLTLKGDTNRTVDPEPYVVGSADRVFFDVPALGYAVAWTASPAGTFAGGFLVALVLFSAFAPAPSRRRPRRRAPARRREKTRRSVPLRPGAGALLVLALVVTGAVHGPRVETTLASWNDTATTATGSFGAHTVPAPFLQCTSGLLLPVRLTWAPVPGATSYTLYYGSNSDQFTAGSQLSKEISSGSGQAWVVAHRSFGSPTTTTWSSVSSNRRAYKFTSILFLGVSSECS